MKRVRLGVSHLKNIIFGYTPFIFRDYKKHLELYRILRVFRRRKLIKSRTYRIYLFTYVSKRLTIRDKLYLLTSHYRFVQQSFDEEGLGQIYRKGLKCWYDENEIGRFSIHLKGSDYLEFEGSLTLLFSVNDRPIFNLNFSFGKGEIFGLSSGQTVIFVSGLKGIENELPNVALVTRSFLGMSPRIILMKVLEGIALSLDVKNILGVNVANQVSFNPRIPQERFYGNYDRFWERLDGKKMSEGYYSFDCPIPEKPLDMVKNPYRKRTQARRDMLKEILHRSEQYLNSYLKI